MKIEKSKKSINEKYNPAISPSFSKTECSSWILVPIATLGDKNVYVIWWERNQTMNEPLMRAGNDYDKTFGEIICSQVNGN